MNLQEIKSSFSQHKHAEALLTAIASPLSKTQLKGLKGSAAAFVAASAFEHCDKNFVLILRDKEEAAYFFNDVESIAGKNKVLFYPTSYRHPYEVEQTDNSNILLRAEVLNKVGRGTKKFIIVSYAEALAEYVVTKKRLSSNTLQLKKADKVSIDFINEMLFEYGFERTDYVNDPGQFSIRGGIIDIYSFANDYPYRVEFFGNDIESIRTFDPVNQLSIALLEEASIVPNVQGKKILEERQSFLEYVSNDASLWFKDYRLSIDQLDKELEEAEKAFQKLNSPLDHLTPNELYISGNKFKEQSQEFNLISFGNQYFQESHILEYNTSPQPHFNKNFDLLKNNLKENASKGLNNILFADTAKQVERLHAIFEDIGADVHFTPINLSIHEGFVDHDLKIACYTDHQIFERYHRFRLKSGFNKKKEALTLNAIKGLQPGDYVTHIDHGIGKFAGLEKMEVNGKMQEVVRLMYKDSDMLYVSIHSLHRIAKYSGKEGAEPKIHKLGANAWQNLKQKTKTKVKEVAFDLIKLYAKRKAKKGFAYSPDTYLQNELEASFIFEDTPDQITTTQQVKEDMELPSPMDRLVCGDVGFGKTEIAIRAAFKAVSDSKQVAILAPTTILTMQHAKTFSERLKDFPCRVDYINRFKSTKNQKESLKKLASGETDIIIGTHRLVGKDVKFKDLGLLIIDEEQKFGVSVKDKLKTFKENVDTLTLTATPIPRTLQFSMMGTRDLSVISTPPPNRYPVQTELHAFNEELIRDAIMYELSRGGQVFFVHNRVQSIDEVAGMIQRLCPDVKVAIGHGQMDGAKLEKVMLDFIDGAYDVLVATTIIESGLDISNVNTILINEAHRFGLSDLHQMRGRVGRSNKKAFCYLFTPPLASLTADARKRLIAIEEFSDLGSGFNIAMRDLDIRGAGNLLGAEQSGFINDIGFEMYQKILDEAIQELKEKEFKEYFQAQEKAPEQIHQVRLGNKRFINDCNIDTDLEILIPDNYVNNIAERLNLYKRLDNAKNEEKLAAFKKELEDRFGAIPQETLELINTIRLRWLAMDLGFEKLILKKNKMLCYFISKQESPYYQSKIFSNVLSFVQQNPSSCKMKEGDSKLSLIFENVKSIDEALIKLKPMLIKEEVVKSQ